MKTLYKNQSGKIGYWTIEVTDNAELNITHARTLDGKATSRLVQVEGKNIGRASETTPLEQAHKEAESRIKKQLDKGYVEDMQAAEKPVTNTLGFTKPTLATVFSKVKPERIDWETAYIQRKIDGHRCMYRDGVLYSRGGKVINLPHILEEIERLDLQEVPLDGELYIHGEALQKIGSLVKRLQPDSEKIKYYVYDIVDEEKSFSDRFLSLKMPASNIIHKLGTEKVDNLEQAKAINKCFVEDGYEGSIIRYGTEGYQSDKRSVYLLKLKAYLDAEVEVIGWKEGQAYQQRKDSPLFRVPVLLCKNKWGGEDFYVTAPGTYEEKNEQFEVIEDFMGEILNIEYFCLSTENVPLQPTAVRWRIDL